MEDLTPTVVGVPEDVQRQIRERYLGDARAHDPGSGRFSTSGRPGLRQIAAEFGVSLPTVSKIVKGTYRPRVYQRTPLATRFATKYRIDEKGCWIWTGAVRGRRDSRHGIISLGGASNPGVLAYRASYELFIGPIPDGMNVCHRCDVRLCVNPAHLFVGDQKANMQDQSHKGRWRNQFGSGWGVEP